MERSSSILRPPRSERAARPPSRRFAGIMALFPAFAILNAYRQMRLREACSANRCNSTLHEARDPGMATQRLEQAAPFETSEARTVARLLAGADVRIGGDRPWDITVHEPLTFRRLLSQGSLGLGESYLDGWWDCEALDAMFYRVLSAGLPRGLRNWPLVLGSSRRGYSIFSAGRGRLSLASAITTSATASTRRCSTGA